MSGSLLARDELPSPAQDAMYALLCRQFLGVSRTQFNADLDEKNWVVQLHRGHELVGFSTLKFRRARHRGKSIGVVCSGDTVVDPSAWKSCFALSSYWIGTINYLRRVWEVESVYWLLIVSGYRTYRFLPIYWRRFHPRFDATTAPGTVELMNRLARDQFGNAYHQDKGIVRFPQPQVLRDELCGIPDERLGDRHVAFFAERNPGHQLGDELVCFTELSHENLTPAGRRMWAKGDRLIAEMVTTE